MVVLALPRQFTVAEDHRLIGFGILADDDRIERIDGAPIARTLTSKGRRPLDPESLRFASLPCEVTLAALKDSRSPMDRRHAGLTVASLFPAG